MFRPFKPPTFVNKPEANTKYRTPANSRILTAPTLANPDNNKRKHDSDDCEVVEVVDFVDVKRSFVPPSKTLKRLYQNEPTSELNSKAGVAGTTATTYYSAVYRKITMKKHKTWDGDGVLGLKGNVCTLQDMTGRLMGKTKCQFSNLASGEIIRIGLYETEADCLLDERDVKSGRIFVRSTVINTIDDSDDDLAIVSAPIKSTKPVKISKPDPVISIPPSSVLVGAAFKAPYLKSNTIPINTHTTVPTPRHSPTGPHALVMPRPKPVPGKQIVDVVVDPALSKHLRPHQRDGVTFLYECVMGLKSNAGTGALLADEMGLGKTLMTITLLWTLLKQNPIWGQPPVAKKVLIVCPVTLINNWRRELRKWLGRERVAVFVVDAKSNLLDFTKGRVYQVMIIGYEKLRLVQNELMDVTFDLLVCDESHRLKSSTSKSAKALNSLKTPRRVMLTGTPIQNDLGEFYTMIDFVNPDLFSSYNAFKREFELPIIRSRQPDARKADIELGRARLEGLSTLTKNFVLRRTAEVLSAYLPPKNEFVIFCRPSSAQLNICRTLLESTAMKSILRSDDMANHLRAITALKKVCNSPKLLLNPSATGGDQTDNSLLADIDLSRAATAKSGKLTFLDCFLQQLFHQTDEKVVLVSSFTQTLDLLQGVVSSIGATYLRLDGSTPAKKRQEIVDTFNKQDKSESFAFLLSAKSGGAGINLIGASRLVLFDTDWNPSVDMQAMARIHRDGQKRPVYIYRLLTTGCIDEKIYQRQLTKQGLADNLMDGKASSAENSFTLTELKDIFTLYPDTTSHTHDLLTCTCDGTGDSSAQTIDHDGSDDQDSDEDDDGLGWMSASLLLLKKAEPPKRLQASARLNALLEYAHIEPKNVIGKYDDLLESKADVIGDQVLQTALEIEPRLELVSYLFRKMSDAAAVNDDDEF
ncbi:SNF2 family N-terminal domain-containing protein [Lipomyces arxii]|uniref:SNF2 family N-terminal domain-containing protein n=1 Tax=Lipomyces arxii TaxID=56418 RepID=UPI0034CD8569